jgi:hypothetical protein
MSFPFAGIAPYSQLYADPTAAAHATIGTLAQDEDGGLWRYCYAGGTLTDMLGAGNYSQPKDCTPYATVVGSWTLKVTETTCAKNAYANGCIVLVCATAGARLTYMIKSNTVSTGVYTILTLKSPIKIAVVATDYATMHPSRFADVRSGTAATYYMSVVCMPMQAVTSTYYFWGKTRGVVYVIPSNTSPGAAARDRMCTFSNDGSVYMADESYNGGYSDQLAGYLIPRTAGTYASGDATLFLQLE